MVALQQVLAALMCRAGCILGAAGLYGLEKAAVICPAGQTFKFLCAPRLTLKSIDDAVVVAKHPTLNGLKTEPLIESMSALIAGERVD